MFQNDRLSIDNVQKLNGPLEWADGLATDHRGLLLVTQNDANFDLSVWDLSDLAKIGQRIELSGHEADVHCAKFLWPFLASGGEDKTVRLWKMRVSETVSSGLG